MSADPEEAARAAHNDRVLRRDSVWMGITVASATFLPVFVARLGATPFEVSLLTAIPAIAGVLLSLPIAQLLRRRRQIVPWFGRARSLAHLAYGGMALVVLVVPPPLVVPAVLAVWALAAVPYAVEVVAFPVVMDGAAGPRGRYRLLGTRWATMGLVTGVTVAIAGLLLELLPFPLDNQLAFVAFSLAGLTSARYARRIRVPDMHSAPPAAGIVAGVRASLAAAARSATYRGFAVRQLVFHAGVRLALPLVPLWYVRVVQAPDAWIGIIGTCASLALLLGYTFWRHVSARRGRRVVLLAALLLTALQPALLSMVRDLVLVAALAGLTAFVTAGVDLALFDELLTAIPTGREVEFVAVNTVLVNAVTVGAPIAGAALGVAVGLAPALRVGSVVALVAVALFAHAVRSERAQVGRRSAAATASL